MLKKFFLSLIIFVCAFNAFSSGIMTGEKNIRVIQTKWFDIIYPEGSEKSAEILYLNADSICDEIAEEYGYEWKIRMPVVLSPAEENMNAYWTGAYYNHIVIYDTTEIEDLMVFSDTLLGTFRHELTHAYTYNMKNNLWAGIGNIFGDIVNPGMLFITPGWAEGAAVNSESSQGEGRLNNEFFWQYVKQSKIDGDFPSYSDVQGSSTKYPLGAYYYFNAAFNQWLQKNYGMEKYGAFWYKCVNFQTLSANMAFKAVYGIQITTAWENFVNDIQVPAVKKNPVEAGLTEDFFDNSKPEYSSRNQEAHLYEGFSYCDKGLLFIDKASYSVYFVAKESLDDAKINPKKLFTQNNLKSARISKDGRYIAVTYSSENSGTDKFYIKVYDTEKKRWEKIDGSGLTDGVVIENQGLYYLVALKFHSQNKAIFIHQLSSANQKSDGNSETGDKLIPVQAGTDPFSFVQSDSGFAFLKKQKLVYSVCFASMDGQLQKEYKFPEESGVIRYLAAGSSGFTFSWTKPGSMPRFGKFDEQNEEFTLYDYDLSGGIYYPVNIEDYLIYAGVFFRQNRIFRMKMDTIAALENGRGVKAINQLKAETSGEQSAEIKLPSKKYNPFSYYRRGLLLPVASVESYSFSTDSSSSYSLPFGLTYISSNPWSQGIIQASAGYGFQTNSGGVQLTYSSGTDTSLLSYSLSAGTEFDRYGWKQANGNLSLTGRLGFGKISAVYLSETSKVYAGRSNLDSAYIQEEDLFIPGSASAKRQEKDFYFGNAVRLSYTNVHRSGLGMMEKAGVNMYSEFDYVYNSSLDFKNLFSNYYDLEFGGALYIPKLIPAQNKLNVTWTLPVILSGYVCGSSSSTFSYSLSLNFKQKTIINPNLAGFAADVLLLGLDFQKGNSLIFLRDLKIEGIYKCGYSYMYTQLNRSMKILYADEYLRCILNGTMPFCQVIGLRSVIDLGLNFGTFASYNAGGFFGAEISVGIVEYEVTPVLTLGFGINLP